MNIMNTRLSSEDRERIRQSLQQKYSKVAESPEGKFRYPVGRSGLEGQKYDPEILKALPEEVLSAYCGVGNPFLLGPVHEGESVLDIGCGAGVDTLVAALMVGPQGRVAGVDVIPEMLRRARENLARTTIENVEFQEASAENLPYSGESFDVVISNGAFNLVTDKMSALSEAFRVLKPGGRFMMADQVLVSDAPVDTRSMVESWAR